MSVTAGDGVTYTYTIKVKSTGGSPARLSGGNQHGTLGHHAGVLLHFAPTGSALDAATFKTQSEALGAKMKAAAGKEGVVVSDNFLAKHKLKVGDTAPDFTLLAFDGKELKKVSLQDYRGKKNVALAFFVFAFTGG